MKNGDFSWKKEYIMIKILGIKNSKNMDIPNSSLIASKIGINRHDKIYNELLKELKENKIFKVKSTIGNAIIFNIDFIKLRDYVTNTELVKTIYSDLLVKEWRIPNKLDFD